MIRKIASQERVLPRMCKVLNFHFDFDLEQDYMAEIEYIQDMNTTNVPDDELYPIRLHVHGNDVWYIFKRSFQDRVYCLTVFEQTDENTEDNKITLDQFMF